MKTVSVLSSNIEYLNILEFGTEEDWKKAKWGPGARNLYILHYVLEGKGYFNSRPVQKGQGFLIRPNERVEYHSDEKEPWRYVWIIFTGTIANAVCREYLWLNENNIFDYGNAADVRELAQRLLGSTMSQPKALAYFYDILSHHVKEVEPPKNRYVIEAKEYIRVRLGEPILVSEVAERLGISDRYLYNLFVKYEGMSPKEYINRVRLRRAESLLRNESNSVTEVAASVGFYDVLAFSRFFSKKKGMCPSDYRKMQSAEPEKL